MQVTTRDRNISYTTNMKNGTKLKGTCKLSEYKKLLTGEFKLDFIGADVLLYKYGIVTTFRF